MGGLGGWGAGGSGGGWEGKMAQYVDAGVSVDLIVLVLFAS